MPLRLTPAPTFRIAVRIPQPGGDPQDLQVRYRWLDAEGFAAWDRSAVDDGTGKHRRDADLLAEVITDIEGLEADDGTPLSYSPKVLADFLARHHAMPLALYSAYRDELFGLPGARQKN